MNNKIIVVLGMHRSGTSAITRGLYALGVNLGGDLLAAMEGVNDKGFWEDSDVNKLNIELLQLLNTSWDALAPLPSIKLDQEPVFSLKEQAKILIHAKTSSGIFGVKDPRTVLLLPFWQAVFDELGITPSYVITSRHPKCVALSLHKRDGIEFTKSYYLWMEHVISAVLETANSERVVVDFDELMLNPISQLERISRAFNLPFNPSDKEVLEYTNGFLDSKLRHFNFDIESLHADKTIPNDVADAYDTLLQIARDQLKLESNEVQELFNIFRENIRKLTPMLEFVNKVTSERDSAVSERDSAVSERDSAVSERDSAVILLNEIKDSISWRITHRLRSIAHSVRYGVTMGEPNRLFKKLHFHYQQLSLPIPLRRAISFGYHSIARRPVSIYLHVTANKKNFQLPAFKPTVREQNISDYIIWGIIDWDFRYQRPQHIASELAASNRRVFYVSDQLLDHPISGFDVQPLDESGRLFHVKLYGSGIQSIHRKAPSVEEIRQLRAGIGELMEWANIHNTVSLVQHAFWYDVANCLPHSRVVYDCMDHHDGFGNIASEIIALERALIAYADLTVMSSDYLKKIIMRYTDRQVLIRNAAEYNHFAQEPDAVFKDEEGRSIIGYYGAIAEWFDQDLVEAIAAKLSNCLILLVGADSVNAKKRLGHLKNVKFIGEVSYDDLPYYLHSFNVCMLPFQICPLTLATNPIKVYEYLSAGKAVVSVDLPELQQFDELVSVAIDAPDFINMVIHLLEQPPARDVVSRRQGFARQQTWSHRVEVLINRIEAQIIEPLVSVVVVTYNNIDLTKACLFSLNEHSDYTALEIIIVDNASTDGSCEYLTEWAAATANRKLILNDENKGFAAANNQGLEVATGEFLVLLNNDTFVTPGWVLTMIRHLQRDTTIGLIGPVTNNIGNEARIDISYSTMDEMLCASASYTRRHIGQKLHIRTTAFFCVMMPLSVYQKVGPLDEAFGRGFFEDDDYCRRVEQLGLRIVCAEDVFVHHHLSASFGKLKQKDRQRLFEDNRLLYEKKWGPWIPHGYREVRPLLPQNMLLKRFRKSLSQLTKRKQNDL
ncbi:MAG: glycosyltransferase [Gammaproteobacteria bacterium]|nr:glycosyltransferase [Gammaproteobacteria bacterium]